MTIAEHLVATTRGGDRSLVEPERAGWLWRRLQASFPEALSNLFMPDHLHMMAASGLRPRLRRVLASFTARYGVRFDVLPPQPAASPAIVGRMIRYGLFNPVRAGLVDDPLAWPWSTLRDLVGATAEVWTPISRVASVLRLSADASLRALTTLGETRMPPVRSSTTTAASVDAVKDAVASALRLSDLADFAKTSVRRLVVQTYCAVGSPRSADLAQHLGCSVRSIERDRTMSHAGVEAALRCLGDPRLRIHALRPR